MTKEEQDILFGRYERYYSKIPGIVTLIDSRSIEPYLTDDDILAPDIDEDLYMSLNHPNSMRKIICENFYDGCGLYEGLITAYPLKKVTQQYVEYCNENLPNDLKDLEISEISVEYPAVDLPDYPYAVSTVSFKLNINISEIGSNAFQEYY